MCVTACSTSRRATGLKRERSSIRALRVGFTEPQVTMAESIRIENRTDAEIAKARTCLDRILASPCFVQSERQLRFLKFIVTESLAGRNDRLKRHTITVVDL